MISLLSGVDAQNLEGMVERGALIGCSYRDSGEGARKGRSGDCSDDSPGGNHAVLGFVFPAVGSRGPGC